MATQIQGAKIVTEEIENSAGANPYSITLGTESTTTGGTAIDFTGIPTGTSRIIVMLVGVSTSGTSNQQIQIGDSGGIETSGYLSTVSNNNAGATSFTAAYGLNDTVASAGVTHGNITLTLEDATNNTWTCTSLLARSDFTVVIHGAGSKSLSGELTQLRITMANGSDTFDVNGGVNIQYQQENNMADVIEVNVMTGEETTRSYTQQEKDNIAAAQPTTDEKWVRIRSQRDMLLRECDWWASSDLTMSDAQTAYRQNLRDVPTQSDVDNITWPTKP